MNKDIQKKIWQNEHLTSSTLPSLAQLQPSETVVNFIDYLKSQNLINKFQKIIDIGCGKGRNSIYLARQDFQVYAVDFIEHAINHAKNYAHSEGLSEKINFSITRIDREWNFPNNYFDFAVDCFSSIDIGTFEGRQKYKTEMFRTLKHGGYALVSVVSANDEFEKMMIQDNPGHEKNSSIWPSNGKFQKNYDEAELREFYQEFEIVELKEYQKIAHKLNKDFLATNFWVLLKKR